jgi:hypothetical protein
MDIMEFITNTTYMKFFIIMKVFHQDKGNGKGYTTVYTELQVTTQQMSNCQASVINVAKTNREDCHTCMEGFTAQNQFTLPTAWSDAKHHYQQPGLMANITTHKPV